MFTTGDEIIRRPNAEEEGRRIYLLVKQKIKVHTRRFLMAVMNQGLPCLLNLKQMRSVLLRMILLMPLSLLRCRGLA